MDDMNKWDKPDVYTNRVNSDARYAEALHKEMFADVERMLAPKPVETARERFERKSNAAMVGIDPAIKNIVGSLSAELLIVVLMKAMMGKGGGTEHEDTMIEAEANAAKKIQALVVAAKVQ